MGGLRSTGRTSSRWPTGGWRAVQRPRRGGDRQPGDPGPGRRKPEGPAPAQQIARDAGEQEGQAGADAEGRRVEGDVARLFRPLQPVGQHPQAGHVDPGQADAHQGVQDGGTPEAVGEQGEAELGRARQRRRRQEDPQGVEAVGQQHQDRHRRHVAAEIGAVDDAGLGVAELPFDHQARHQRREGREAEHAERLRQAQHEDEADGAAHRTTVMAAARLPGARPVSA